ncbi:MAG TPA: glucokinase [Methyloceanibacter sp.]|nr:glucokinase [Methyloceanibacter sp.]
MNQARQYPAQALVADIGGTNARFALADPVSLQLTEIRQVRCAQHPNLEAALSEYVGALSKPPERAAIAVAAPVTGGQINFTNSTWSFAEDEIRGKVGLRHIRVLNDFEALALSLPHLASGELHQIGGDTPIEHANKLALGPGTGLGVAGLAWSGERWVALPGEGGHMSLGAKDAEQLALLERIRKGRDHLSAERVLSGPGLAELYQAVSASHGLKPAALEPSEVLTLGLNGEDEVAAETLELFVAWLGGFAGDAALLMGARGGVYLGGGIAPRILSKLSAGEFRRSFEHKGRMSAYLAPVPVYVITADFATLKGAAAALRDLPAKVD